MQGGTAQAQGRARDPWLVDPGSTRSIRPRLASASRCQLAPGAISLCSLALIPSSVLHVCVCAWYRCVCIGKNNVRCGSCRLSHHQFGLPRADSPAPAPSLSWSASIGRDKRTRQYKCRSLRSLRLRVCCGADHDRHPFYLRHCSCTLGRVMECLNDNDSLTLLRHSQILSLALRFSMSAYPRAMTESLSAVSPLAVIVLTGIAGILTTQLLTLLQALTSPTHTRPRFSLRLPRLTAVHRSPRSKLTGVLESCLQLNTRSIFRAISARQQTFTAQHQPIHLRARLRLAKALPLATRSTTARPTAMPRARSSRTLMVWVSTSLTKLNKQRRLMARFKRPSGLSSGAQGPTRFTGS